MKTRFLSAIAALGIMAASSTSLHAQWNVGTNSFWTYLRVGIGISTPADQLHLSEGPTHLERPVMRLSRSDQEQAGQLGLITNDPSYLSTMSGAAAGDLVLAAGLQQQEAQWDHDLLLTNRYAGGKIRFGTAELPRVDRERMVITSKGRIGVGTDQPLDRLHIVEEANGLDRNAVVRWNSSLHPDLHAQIGILNEDPLTKDDLTKLSSMQMHRNSGDFVVAVGRPHTWYQDLLLTNRCGNGGHILFATSESNSSGEKLRMKITDQGVIAMGNPPEPWTHELWKVWMGGPVQIGSATEAGSLTLTPAGNQSWFHVDNQLGVFRLTSGALKPTSFDPTPAPRHVILQSTDNGNIMIGADENPATLWNSPYKLQVKGTIRAKEMLVEVASWPDYVFASDYNLLSLADVEKHIKDNKHLPGIPSAAEVEAGGMKVGDIQAKLLQKIEELTLYVIDQDKRLKSLEEENRELRDVLTGDNK